MPGGCGRAGRTPSGVGEASAAAELTDLPLAGREAAESGRPIDLLAEVARPWGLDLAAAMTRAPRDEVARLRGWAREVFRGAASAREFGVSQGAAEATSALAVALGGAEAPGRAQAFVALAETLPRLLAGVWFVLTQRPEVVREWKDRPGTRGRAMEELIRIASPSRLVFRMAAAPVEIGGVVVPEGDAVHLALGAANHDPDTFPLPHQPRTDRKSSAHLSFGRGSHACPGAALIRRAAAHATERLLADAAAISLAGPVHWEGHAIRAPTSLPVHIVRSA